MEMEKDYEAECDARSLIDAAEVLGDKKRLAAAKAMVEKKKKAFASLDELKAFRQAVAADPSMIESEKEDD